MSKLIYAPAFTDEIRDLIEDVCDGVGYDAYYHDVNPISAESYSGFIAFTDGGWDGVVTFGFHGEEAWSTDAIRPYVERDHDECVAAFRSEHRAVGR